MKIYTIILLWGLKIEKMCDKELIKFLEIILCICKYFFFLLLMPAKSLSGSKCVKQKRNMGKTNYLWSTHCTSSAGLGIFIYPFKCSKHNKFQKYMWRLPYFIWRYCWSEKWCEYPIAPRGMCDRVGNSTKVSLTTQPIPVPGHRRSQLSALTCHITKSV